MDEQILLIHQWLNNHEALYLIADAFLFLFYLVGVLYLFIFALCSLKKRRDVYPPARQKYRFAVLFPAYQEDEVIVESVQTFFKQEYPRELYDIIVLSDHMSDHTNHQLRNLSATVIEVKVAESTKTKALQLAVDYIEEKKLQYDIVLIMDATNVTHTDYLDQINDAFYSGCSAAQTHRVAKNRDTNIAILDAVSEEINNSIFRKGHTRLGFSSALIGSGMAFEYELFHDSIAQVDAMGIEKQLERTLLMQNIYIEYLEDVYVFDEKVKGSAGFYSQRRRWLANQFGNLRNGIMELPLAMIRGNWDYCDKLFQWMMPPRVILFGFILLFALFFTVFDWTMSVKWWGLLFLSGITLSIAIPDYLVDSRFTKALANIPILFLLMCMNLFRIRGMNKRPSPTKRTHAPKPD